MYTFPAPCQLVAFDADDDLGAKKHKVNEVRVKINLLTGQVLLVQEVQAPEAQPFTHVQRPVRLLGFVYQVAYDIHVDLASIRSGST